jgi:DNA-binding response OmpR family regulator
MACALHTLSYEGKEKAMAKKILIIDDNELMIEVMTYILTNNGYEVVSFNDGGNIFNEIRITHPDLVILDALLPGMDGRDICKLIKLNNDTKTLPVIICTGSEDINDSLSQKGAPDDVLHKPFDISNLIEKVEYQLAA